jgi:hypothetical protein
MSTSYVEIGTAQDFMKETKFQARRVLDNDAVRRTSVPTKETYANATAVARQRLRHAAENFIFY